MSSWFFLASLVFMLGFLAGGAANERRSRRPRPRRPSTSTFASDVPDDAARARSNQGEATPS